MSLLRARNAPTPGAISMNTVVYASVVMNTANLGEGDRMALGVQGTQRWEIYQRLQQLAIPCFCAMHQPLEVGVDSPAAAIQLWSVVKQLTASRQEHLDWLERCWHLARSETA